MCEEKKEMNLQENINRIKQVMGILTEGKLEMFQELVNKIFNDIENDCKDIDADTFPGDLSFSSCDECEHVIRLTVINFEWVKSKLSNSTFLKLLVDVDLSTINRISVEHLLFDLSKRMSDWIGSPVNVESNNVEPVHFT